MNNLKKIIKKYHDYAPLFTRLGKNIQESLLQITSDEGISINTIDFRVKKVDSFLEKIDRKKYKNPFEQTTDLCGLRVVCFFQSDVEKIQKIIEREFVVVEEVTKGATSETGFGYRSKHYIVKIKDEWANTPHYRNLKNINVEVQVRTILMHAWAEIEHKLAYKKIDHVPSKFRRKFALISAKLEEVDEQFEDLAQEIKKMKELSLRKQNSGEFDSDLEMNLDNLQAYLDYFYVDQQKNVSRTRDLLDEILLRNISIKDLIELQKAVTHEHEKSEFQVDAVKKRIGNKS